MLHLWGMTAPQLFGPIPETTMTVSEINPTNAHRLCARLAHYLMRLAGSCARPRSTLHHWLAAPKVRPLCDAMLSHRDHCGMRCSSDARSSDAPRCIHIARSASVAFASITPINTPTAHCERRHGPQPLTLPVSSTRSHCPSQPATKGNSGSLGDRLRLLETWLQLGI